MCWHKKKEKQSLKIIHKTKKQNRGEKHTKRNNQGSCCNNQTASQHLFYCPECNRLAKGQHTKGGGTSQSSFPSILGWNDNKTLPVQEVYRWGKLMTNVRVIAPGPLAVSLRNTPPSYAVKTKGMYDSLVNLFSQHEGQVFWWTTSKTCHKTRQDKTARKDKRPHHIVHT